MPAQMTHTLESRWKNINNLRYADDTTLMAESEEELKSLLMKVKERDKAGLNQYSKNEDHGNQSYYFMAKRWGKIGNSGRFYFCEFQNHCRRWLQPGNEKTLAPWKKIYDKPRQYIKKQRHYFTNEGPCSQSYVFSSNHAWMWVSDHKEGWAPKNWCFQTVVLEKSLGLQDQTSQS